MIYISLGLVAALLVCVLAFSGLIRSLVRQHARREDLLLNQLLNLAGKPWQPAPANDVPQEDDLDELARYVWNPSQLPEEED